MADRKIIVEIIGEDRRLTGTLKDATAKVEGFGGKLRNVGKGLAIGAGVASFNLLTSAIQAGVSQLDEMHQAFLDDEASRGRLQNALKNTVKNYEAATKSAEDFAAAQQSLGFEDDSVRDSLVQLVGITHDLAKAQELSSVAMDLARAKNISFAQATDIVARAYTGVARGLTLVGIDARGAATGQELVKRIMDNTKGAAEAYAKTASGKVAKANAKMQDTFEKLGGVIDKVSQVAIPILVDGFAEIVAIGEDTIGMIQRAIDGFGLLNDAIGRFGEDKLGGLIAVKDLLGTIVSMLPGANVLGLPTNQGGGVTSTTTGGVTSTHYPGGFGGLGGKVGGSFHDGGIVPGPYGSDQLIMAQAGERIVPTGQAAAGQTIIVNIASFIGSDRDIDRFSDRLAFRLRSTSLS